LIEWCIFEIKTTKPLLPRDAMHKRSLCLREVSVLPSHTFVDSVKTNKHIFKIFSPSGSHVILVFFRSKRCGNILTETTNRGVEYRWGRQKSRFSATVWLSDRWLLDVRATIATVHRAV